MEIFSEKTRLQFARSRASSWDCCFCWAVEQRAYPIRIAAAVGAGFYARAWNPGLAGTAVVGHGDVEELGQVWRHLGQAGARG
ncbi:hypothetical protein OG711_37650 [Streptomyces uncialis]|uniref:hypothetical protein n=1 Tax=Streptomyces uncialis TaxID=1048205 RepID=UPI002E2F5394|nr:hypothetical protein [Streptomyces uncialis]